MSSSKGNISRSRGQKYQNRTAFKNDLHDKSAKCKHLNSMSLTGLCDRCREIIQWKIKYKKYKTLRAPAVCARCHEKAITSAYRVICNKCSLQDDQVLCTKCLQPYQTIEKKVETDPVDNREIEQIIKSLPERKRRTFIRFMQKQSGEKKKPGTRCKGKNPDAPLENDDSDEESDAVDPQIILDKINKLKLSCRKNSENDDLDDFDSDGDFPQTSTDENDDDDSDCDSPVLSENTG